MKFWDWWFQSLEECSGGKVAVILNIKEYKQSAIGKGVGDERDGFRSWTGCQHHQPTRGEKLKRIWQGNCQPRSSNKYSKTFLVFSNDWLNLQLIAKLNTFFPFFHFNFEFHFLWAQTIFMIICLWIISVKDVGVLFLQSHSSRECKILPRLRRPSLGWPEAKSWG